MEEQIEVLIGRSQENEIAYDIGKVYDPMSFDETISSEESYKGIIATEEELNQSNITKYAN